MAITGRVRTANGLLNKWPLGPSSLMGRTLDENFEAIDAFMNSGVLDPLFSVGSNGIVKAPTQDDVDNNRILKAANGGGAWVADAVAVVFSQDTAGIVNGPTAADIAANRIPRADNTWIDQPSAGLNGTGVLQAGTDSNAGGTAADSGLVTASGNQGFAIGFATGANSAVQVLGVGSAAMGFSNTGGKITAALNGEGNLARGHAENGGEILAASQGAMASGYVGGAGGGGTITADQPGAHAFGRATDEGNLHSDGFGALAFGQATDNAPTALKHIHADANGSLAGGSSAFGQIRTSGTGGSFAFGYVWQSGRILHASGLGSMAIGFCDGADIVCSGVGSQQFGHGTNATDKSFQIGDVAMFVHGSDLIGFFAAAPVAQPASADQTALGAATTVGTNTGTPAAGLSLIGDTSTVDQSAALMNDLASLRRDVANAYTLINALRLGTVNLGLLKGAA